MGFWTDYARFRLGLSEKHAAWVVSTIEDIDRGKVCDYWQEVFGTVGQAGLCSTSCPLVAALVGVVLCVGYSHLSWRLELQHWLQ